MSSDFETLRSWAEARGLILHSALERKVEGGVGGMFALGAIQKGEVLAALPKSALIPVDESIYHAQVSLSAKQIHSACKAYIEGSDGPFAAVFKMLDDVDTLKAFSTYYIENAELQRIAELSSGLAMYIQQQNQRHHTLVTALHEFDSSIPLAVFEMMMLAYDSRAMG